MYVFEYNQCIFQTEIVDFSARRPEQFKIRGKQTKVVLRHLMQSALPQSVLRQPKIGLNIPIHAWFRGALQPLLAKNLNEISVEKTGHFEWPEVKALIEAQRNCKANWGYHLWGLLMLLLWMKRWKIETPAMELHLQASCSDATLGDSSLAWQPVSYSARMPSARRD